MLWTVKDASVYKGDLIELEKPQPPVSTGDATSIIAALALVTLCTLAGVSFGKKR